MANETNVLILGAGPAGLAAGYELARHGTRVSIVEKNADIGGLSRSDKVKGCFFDLGPHIFIKRNQRIIDFWKTLGKGELFELREKSGHYYDRRVFGSYTDIFWSMPLARKLSIVAGFAKSTLLPNSAPDSCHAVLVDQYGAGMYRYFQKDFHGKFWGVPLTDVDKRAVRSAGKVSITSLARKATARFLPATPASATAGKPQGHLFFHHTKGSGAMYRNLARLTTRTQNATYWMRHAVHRVDHDGKRITAVVTRDALGRTRTHRARHVISTIPLNVFLQKMNPRPPKPVLDAASKLFFRDVIAVNLVVKGNPFSQQWLQVISNDLAAYRLTNFRNLSPGMGHTDLTPVGIEYNCFAGDAFWAQTDDAIVANAIDEMDRAGLISKDAVVAGHAVRFDHVYPVYFKGYEPYVATVLDYLNSFSNLQPISRSSVYRYNNMGHAVESGLTAADNVLGSHIDAQKLDAFDASQDLYATRVGGG